MLRRWSGGACSRTSRNVDNHTLGLDAMDGSRMSRCMMWRVRAILFEFCLARHQLSRDTEASARSVIATSLKHVEQFRSTPYGEEIIDIFWHRGWPFDTTAKFVQSTLLHRRSGSSPCPPRG